MSGALSHIKVVDLAVARAGPSCVRILSDLGASVIQVVRPAGGGGDIGLPSADRENLHRNKRSIALDLQQRGRSRRASSADRRRRRRGRELPRRT